MTERLRQYWALCANPDMYRIEDAVAEVEFDNWVTKGSDIRAGDRAIVWKAKGSTNTRGIVALADVIADPASAPDLHPEYGRDLVPNYRSGPMEKMATFRYVRATGLPLWLDGPYRELLSRLSIVRGNAQRSVYRVQPDIWNMIVAACGGWPDEQHETERLLVNRTHNVQGRVTDTAVRRAIELHAMSLAEEHYRKRGWHVHDVSSERPYDLHCSKPNSELHVEVKGTTSDGLGVFLTRNEVAHARLEQTRTALFVVSRIRVQVNTVGISVTSGGEVHVLQPWNVDAGELEPLTYSYRAPGSLGRRPEEDWN